LVPKHAEKERWGVTVAVVQHIADPVLGAGTAVKSIALARALASAGAKTLFITTDIGLGAHSIPDLPGVDVTVVSSRFARFPIPQIGRRVMDRLIEGCDVVILLNHWTVLNALAYRAAHRQGVPYILCPAGALRIQGRSHWLKFLYQLLVGRRMVAEAGALIATTELEAMQFRADGVPAARIRVIPNGIDSEPVGISAEEFRIRRHVPAGPLLLYMGRLNPLKGPDLLLEAFGQVANRFGDWRLVLAGRDEGLERQLRLRTATLGLSERVHFVGHLDPSESTGAYRAASLLVVPSRHEAMSLVALEAAVSRTPVLLTDACGFNEVEDADGGRVVPATAAGLAAGLSSLLSEPGKLADMGIRLRGLAINHYGWPSIVSQYLELAQELRPHNRSPVTS
jgi:glycosyltransferase involved in cell wall biosynthesis